MIHLVVYWPSLANKTNVLCYGIFVDRKVHKFQRGMKWLTQDRKFPSSISDEAIEYLQLYTEQWLKLPGIDVTDEVETLGNCVVPTRGKQVCVDFATYLIEDTDNLPKPISRMINNAAHGALPEVLDYLKILDLGHE